MLYFIFVRKGGTFEFFFLEEHTLFSLGVQNILFFQVFYILGWIWM